MPSAAAAPSGPVIEAILAAGYTLDQARAELSNGNGASSKVGFSYDPLPKGFIETTYRAYGSGVAPGLVLLATSKLLNPKAPPKLNYTREELADLFRCTPQNVDKALAIASAPLKTEDGREFLGPVQYKRDGKGMAISICRDTVLDPRFTKIVPKELKTIADREEREKRKKAEEEALRAKIAEGVEQRIIAKAGELVCPKCGSEHTGLVCQDCGAMTPIERAEAEPQVITPAVAPPPPQPKPAPKKSESTTPVAPSNGSETTTPVVLLVLFNALRAVFLTKVGKRLEKEMARTICLGLRLKPSAPCTEADRALIAEYLLHFNRADWKKHTSGYAASGPFLDEVRETYEEKLKMPPGTADSPPSIEERMRLAHERLKKRGLA